MRDEAELIRRSAAGDLTAFEELILLKRDRVYRTAYQVVRNVEDARDVTQLVFVKLWRVLRRYRAERKFDTWLYRITFNLAIDARRQREKRAREVPLEELAGGSSEQGPAGRRGIPTLSAPESETPSAVAERTELQEILRAIASELTDRQRAMFTMREVEGLSVEEIAWALGVTRSTVRNTIFQARAILREAFRRRFPDYDPTGGSEDDPGSEGSSR